ncbi:MAG: hypothetical protein D6690_04090 [Nitrospirae bacterium]|nr:MAG: hypothetical protein D6690_04090 [Nitrospirota bacterium]
MDMTDGRQRCGAALLPIRIALFTAVVSWSTACVPPKVSIESAPDFRPSAIRTVAVVPFQVVRTPQTAEWLPADGIPTPDSLRSQFVLPLADEPLTREAARKVVPVPPAAAELVTKLVMAELERREGLRLIPPDRVTQVLGGESLASLPKDRVRRLGQELQADAVLVGLVRTYRERVGTKWAATPAAVGFEMQLVNPKDGSVLWSGEFYEEQKPLTEDFLGFIEHGGVFVTAKELAESGVRKLMQHFPLGKVAG